MKKLLRTLALSLLVCLEPAHAVFYDGNKLMSWVRAKDRVDEEKPGPGDYQDNARLQGYVVGTADTLDGVIFCLPTGTSVGQLTAIFAKFVKANPERWGEPGHILVLGALRPVFPCPPK